MCLSCGESVESLVNSPERWVPCKCGMVRVSGGRSQPKYWGPDGGAISMYVYDNIPFQQLRLHYYEDVEGRKVTLAEMPSFFLQLLLETEKPLGGRSWQILLEEKLFRAENELP